VLSLPIHGSQHTYLKGRLTTPQQRMPEGRSRAGLAAYYAPGGAPSGARAQHARKDSTRLMRQVPPPLMLTLQAARAHAKDSRPCKATCTLCWYITQSPPRSPVTLGSSGQQGAVQASGKHSRAASTTPPSQQGSAGGEPALRRPHWCTNLTWPCRRPR